MQRIRKVLRIPKDPRTMKNTFITEIPQDLLHKIDAEEWRSHVEGLNKIMLRKERPSILNTIKMFLVIPAALDLDRYDKDVRKYLKELNIGLKSRGIFIEDPSLNGYTELEVVISEANQ
ncbi:uncharacterized protein VICG_00095 [Vittaforma corneae ATCC 50505]|uniref:Uncharacterized protein n=1 Tax=Vittaforma corneae (strain ATCC 50505) TaxID=993615 RepID=L2GQI5_VITCO|nr:uncharacterized protein VICG_00095 [Vittaforma corneae ATCC 50505]ELA42780.1 hypothetical protein VICG_00095 [Vittaforma corneae ATCC 50505]